MVFIAAGPVDPYVHPLTINSVQGLRWNSPLDILISRNDVSPANTRDGYIDMAAKLQNAREMFLSRDYGAMLVVERDMVIPPDTLMKLSGVEADLVYALYVSRHGDHFWMLRQGDDLVEARKLGYSKSFRREVWGRVVDSDGIGFGCTLIHRRTIEEFPFRMSEDNSRTPDFCMAKDLKNSSWLQKTHCGVVCGHISGNETLWPDLDRMYVTTRNSF